MSAQLTKQEQLFGIRSAEFGTLTASNARLYPFLRSIRALVEEAKIDPTDDGLHVKAVDPANVAMVEATVDLDGDVPDETVGANVKALAGKLQNKPRDATVTVECAMPNGVLRLDEEFANGRVWNIREHIGFLDPDSIRERPDIPELDFDVGMELALDSLSSLISRYPSGHPIEFTAGDGELQLAAIRQSAEDEDGEYHGVATTEYTGTGDATALYGSHYLSDVLAGIRATGAKYVDLSWSDEFPLRLEASGEYVSTEWYIAPRIRQD